LAAPSKASACGRSLSGMGGSNPAGSMEVCPLWVLCIVRYTSVPKADHSSRGVPMSVVHLSMIVKPP
jgi:hypothetical protein